MYKNKVAISRLNELLSYDPESGVLTWRVTRNGRVKAGDKAGVKTKDGYFDVSFDFVKYGAHRLAFALYYGKWPDADVDHVDGDRSNNRIANLRDATRGANLQNQRHAHKDNKTGFLGVSKIGDWYYAAITHEYIKYELGRYETAEKAHAAYLFAKRVMHPTCTL